MACDCPRESKKTYYASIQLFTQIQEGIPAGASRPLPARQVIVCTKCGTSEFSIPELELRWFRGA